MPRRAAESSEAVGSERQIDTVGNVQLISGDRQLPCLSAMSSACRGSCTRKAALTRSALRWNADGITGRVGVLWLARLPDCQITYEYIPAVRGRDS